jgi:hypothetical protein
MLSMKILAILLALTQCKSDYDQVITITQTGCSFKVNSNASHFTFLTCNTPASSLNGNWTDCIASCCPSQSAFALSAPSLNVLIACQQSSMLNQNVSITSFIVFAVIAIIAFTIFICFCCIIVKLAKSFYRNRVTQ